MNIKEIGSRGISFTFDDDITVYLIKGTQKYVLCDTHLGPDSMEVVKKHIIDQLPEKEVVVFNSHSDWDHIWGNCAFKDATIIGHEKARSRMKEIGEFQLNNLKNFHKGKINIKLPNLTFSHKLTLPDEDIEFIHAPGHTVDSSICFDKSDSVLFVGDLVEFPLPYLDYYDLSAFIKTLEFIRGFPAQVKLSAHSGIVNDELIKSNLDYVKMIQSSQPIPPEMIQDYQELHKYNLNNLLLLSYEPLIKEKLGEDFNYALYKSSFQDLEKMDYNDLKTILENYIK